MPEFSNQVISLFHTVQRREAPDQVRWLRYPLRMMQLLDKCQKAN